MGANNTPLFDLIELSSLNSNATFTTAPGGGDDIIGLVDNATYTDGDSSNSATEIAELNETFSTNGGTITIDGMEYSIQLVVPNGFGDDVTITYNGGGSSVDLSGDGLSSDITFIIASPVGGGTDRYFAVTDDAVGDLPNITSIQIRDLDWTPSGDDVLIDLDQNNVVTVCFVKGTLMETETGPRAVEELSTGDLLQTLDHGLRPIRWCWTRTFRFSAETPDKQRPVRIQPDALAPGVPQRELRVSPQHRMLVASKIVERLFGVDQVLIPATKLVGQPGITRDTMVKVVTYCHLFLGSHEVIFAEGAPAESLLPEKEALRALSRAAYAELKAIVDTNVPPAHPIVERGPLLRELLRRHSKNSKPLCEKKLDVRMPPWRRPNELAFSVR
ncbi:MAG: Hint domain-containing protein [Pelagimonas sp.]|uniref:Hint domain-containing protein n=1 Tax=Pelagimonas sp. TaxID=2073170 RepID=UPI003D6BA0EE